MDEKALKDIAINIILQAYADIGEIYKRVNKVRNICTKGELKQYVNKVVEKDRLRKKGFCSSLPFICGEDDWTAVYFFSPDNKWAQTLLNEVDLFEIPKDIMDKVEYLKGFANHCTKCIHALIDEAREVPAPPRIRPKKEIPQRKLLTAKQIMLLNVLTNPENAGKTIPEICKLAGITQNTYRNAFKSDNFISQYDNIREVG